MAEYKRLGEGPLPICIAGKRYKEGLFQDRNEEDYSNGIYDTESD